MSEVRCPRCGIVAQQSKDWRGYQIGTCGAPNVCTGDDGRPLTWYVETPVDQALRAMRAPELF